MAGYVFLVFEDEASVQRLISQCFLDSGRFVSVDSFLNALQIPAFGSSSPQIRWKRSLFKFVHGSSATLTTWWILIIRWTVVLLSSLEAFPDRLVQAGSSYCLSLLNLVEIANALNQIYGPIAYVGVDTDPELKYPKGCARVTFATASGYVAALKQRHVELNHTDTPKRVEIKPYLMEEQMCDNCFGTKCHGQHAQYFCGFDQCLQYYCVRCWDHIHGNHSFAHHRPTVRQGDQTKVKFRLCLLHSCRFRSLTTFLITLRTPERTLIGLFFWNTAVTVAKCLPSTSFSHSFIDTYIEVRLHSKLYFFWVALYLFSLHPLVSTFYPLC